jgi:hypothetical protein
MDQGQRTRPFVARMATTYSRQVALFPGPEHLQFMHRLGASPAARRNGQQDRVAFPPHVPSSRIFAMNTLITFAFTPLFLAMLASFRSFAPYLVPTKK